MSKVNSFLRKSEFTGQARGCLPSQDHEFSPHRRAKHSLGNAVVLVMATDDPGADQALTPPPQNGPNPDKPPCQCLIPSTTPLQRARAGVGDSVGQFCSMTRGLMDRHLASWPGDAAQLGLLAPGPCQPQPQPGRVGDAKLSQPLRAKVLAPSPSPRACSPPGTAIQA